jgi:hypothetical protein
MREVMKLWTLAILYLR